MLLHDSVLPPRYGSVIVGAILSKLAAKGDPVKTRHDSSGKRRNRRVSFSFHGGMQVFSSIVFFQLESLDWIPFVCFITIKYFNLEPLKFSSALLILLVPFKNGEFRFQTASYLFVKLKDITSQWVSL